MSIESVPPMNLSMPSKNGRGNKWKSHYDTARKFRPEWQTKYPWLQKVTDGSEDAYSGSLCRTNLVPKLSNLNHHEESVKHKRQASLTSCDTKISLTPVKQDELVKEIELQLAVAITCHSSIMAVGHLGEIMVQHGKGSKLEKRKSETTPIEREV